MNNTWDMKVPYLTASSASSGVLYLTASLTTSTPDKWSASAVASRNFSQEMAGLAQVVRTESQRATKETSSTTALQKN